ncbi:hypothetical protein N7470_005181 [Penicillium chermesinum]|nr:hypothetical protein N7470_005181 [Penicillium chermesinum]
MSYLRYLYTKALATLLRAVVLTFFHLAGRRNAHPDEVRHIPCRDKGRTIKVHIYRSSDKTSPSPVLVNFHGSGFMLPLHGSDDEFCRFISSRTKYDVIDVSYRLAPEHPFPAALNDTEDAVKYVLGRPDEFDLTRLSISGFSAGGNLALAAAATLFPQDTFRSVLAIYPSVDLSRPITEKIAPDSTGRPLPNRVLRFFRPAYFPALAPLERFPRRVLMITASGDSLCLEAERLAESLKSVPGSHVVCERMQQCSHGWDKKPRAGPAQAAATKKAYGLAVEMLNE